MVDACSSAPGRGGGFMSTRLGGALHPLCPRLDRYLELILKRAGLQITTQSIFNALG